MQPPSGASQPIYAFGRFRLFPAQRRLEQDGEPVRIGARAFDLLLLLIENAGATVSKQAIWERVWPGIHVGEGSLRFQLVELRRRLDEDGASSCISSVPGRGYCFVGPLRRSDLDILPDRLPASTVRLPARLKRMVGRDDALAALGRLLTDQRFVTIVGAGGVGKTTLAIAAAHDQLCGCAGDVIFVDLGAVHDPALVASAIAAPLGLPVQSPDPTPDIILRLKSRKTLLVLDSVEHLLDAVAGLAERLFAEAPQLRLLVTSREALRVEGEHVYPLEPFDPPTIAQSASLDGLLENPAAELLVERALAADSRLSFVDGDAPMIASICRQLDGVALAIELAAGRVPTHGLQGTSALLGGRLDHLYGGKRTAAPRHRSLSDTLAWSYDLLDGRACTILCRLTAFVGPFSLEAACAVAGDDEIGSAEAARILADLVAKSLVSVRRAGSAARFRLLDTMRAYLREKVVPDEWPAIAARHAQYYCELLQRSTPQTISDGFGPIAGIDDIPNIRAALAWCYAAPGEDRGGTPLAAGAAVLYQRLSLLSECQSVCETAIAALPAAEIGSRNEMELQTCLAQALMYTSGHTPKVLAAFERAMELAARFRETERQLAISSALHVYHNRSANFAQGLAVAERGHRIAQGQSDPAIVALGHISLGIALHHVGRHAEASIHLDEAIELGERNAGIDRIASYSTHPNRARVIVAQSLWLRGFPDQAAAVAHQSLAEAGSLDHRLSLAIALSGVPPVFIWRQDWDEVERLLDRHWTLAEQNSLLPYRALVIGRRGEAAIHTGRAELGVELLDEALVLLHASNYRLFSTPLRMALAQGLAQLGQSERALDEIQACQSNVEPGGDAMYLPELLRIKAVILAAEPARQAEVEPLLRRALTIAREQEALSWELRAATMLAGIWIQRGRLDKARALLQPILDRFSEGYQTADLQLATSLLAHAKGREQRSVSANSGR